jgi:triosephosphate isomerase
MNTLHIIGNWKMNPKSTKEVERFLKEYTVKTKAIKNVQHSVCPPSVFLSNFQKNKKIKYGSQDIHSEKEGAHTGNISAQMVASLGAKFTLVGHSEIRDEGDTNEKISHKIDNAIKAGLGVVLCVGEKSRDTSADYHISVKRDLEESLALFPKSKLDLLTIAYEPVWAIGKNATRQATPEESREMSVFIKKVLTDFYGNKGAEVPVVYGGSVTVENCDAFLREGGVHGLLVGRDSLNASRFSKIVLKASQIVSSVITAKKSKK